MPVPTRVLLSQGPSSTLLQHPPCPRELHVTSRCHICHALAQTPTQLHTPRSKGFKMLATQLPIFGVPWKLETSDLAMWTTNMALPAPVNLPAASLGSPSWKSCIALSLTGRNCSGGQSMAPASTLSHLLPGVPVQTPTAWSTFSMGQQGQVGVSQVPGNRNRACLPMQVPKSSAPARLRFQDPVGSQQKRVLVLDWPASRHLSGLCWSGNTFEGLVTTPDFLGQLPCPQNTYICPGSQSSPLHIVN